MQTLTRQQSIFVRYAPVLLIVSLVWFALTLQYPPISLGYILAWFGVGLAYGVVEFVGSGSRYFRILNFVSTVIVLGGLFLIPNMLGRGPSGWFGSSQGMAILFVCVWTLNWTLGRKMKRRLAMGAVEQIVGREAR